MNTLTELSERDHMYLLDAAVAAVGSVHEQYPEVNRQTLAEALFHATAHRLGLGREGIVSLINDMHAQYRVGQPTIVLTDEDD